MRHVRAVGVSAFVACLLMICGSAFAQTATQPAAPASSEPLKFNVTYSQEVAGNFTGRVYAVNPSSDAVSGLPAYQSVGDIPGDVDVAIVAVPADSVTDVVLDCASKGVHGLVVISAGFAEVHGERARERELVTLARRNGMRLVGPNCMGVLNTDLAGQLEAESLGARLWRLEPGQASTRHRHPSQEELYVLLEGHGRIRVDDEVLDLRPMDSLLVEPASIRQVFNDTADDALWFVAGAPPEEVSSTLDMSAEQLEFMYPDGPKALPPELGGGTAE